VEQAITKRGAETNWLAGLYQDKQRRRLVLAIVLLLAAISAVLIRDYKSAAAVEGDDDATTAVAPPTAPPSIQPVAIPETKAATAQAVRPVVHHKRTIHRSGVSAGNGTVKSAQNSTKTWGPATAASDRRALADDAQTRGQVQNYPLLTEASAVRGSVLLQTLISADGTVQEMRVISGPTILVAAARQAVQQWRFKPYLVDGKPVETYARVTVNLTIDVSNTEARYHVNSITSAGAL